MNDYEKDLVGAAELYAACADNVAAARRDAERSNEALRVASARLLEDAKPLQAAVGRNITERFVVLSDGRVLVVKWIGEQASPLVTIHETVNRG